MLHHGIVKDWVRWEFVSSRTEFKTSLYKKKKRKKEKTSPPDNSQSLLFHDPPLAGQAAAEPPGQSAAPRGSSAAVLPPPPPLAQQTTQTPQGHGALRVLLKNRPPELLFIFIRAFSCSLASSLPLVGFFNLHSWCGFPSIPLFLLSEPLLKRTVTSDDAETRRWRHLSARVVVANFVRRRCSSHILQRRSSVHPVKSGILL